MYRITQNNENDISNIITIYNDITGRKRTVDLHRWEWFESPYKNKSYVILSKENKILGHHGILTIKINYYNTIYIAGKTENTIMQKGYGPIYFKNEKEMHGEYIKEYDILITTAAVGVTEKIRKKLGYEVFSHYISYVRPVSLKLIYSKIPNTFARRLLNLIAPLGDLFFRFKKVNNSYTELINEIKEEDLLSIEKFYNEVKNKQGFSQVRSKDFLTYRILNNPYKTYSILTIYKHERLNGYLLFYKNNDRIVIEDIMFNTRQELEDLLNRLFNYVKRNKLGSAIVLTVLRNSLLDVKHKGFVPKVFRSPKAPVFMLKNNIKDNSKNNLKIENFYFTPLMLEGIQ